ncbi:MAG: UDP-N-acetylmuramoyl-L-alanyl-D-glutamate--2,6-diaminopimelate ligase, partial [[Clostridium] symbiosum]
IQKGAKVLVTEEAVTVPEEITVLRVGNGRNALSLLSAARFGYPARKMTTIGVTGTKGKTTTTYMIKAILEAAGEKTGLIGTNGAIIGSDHFPTMNTTPESYILQEYFAKMVEQGCRYMVMEVSSQSYLMHRVDGIFFDYSIFLNISNDHIGPNEHASFEEYLYYKKLLLQNSRVCLVNRDDGHFREIIEGAKAEIKTFSMEHSADFRAADVKYIREHDFVGLDFKMEGDYESRLRVNVPGLFNVYNAMAAAGVCSCLGLSKERVAHALEHMQVDGRMEIVYKSAKCTVIVDYAHNAVSMESLLMTLRDYKPKRLVVVFGCGGNRARDRRYSMGEIGGKLAYLSIITADNSRFEKTSDILADIKTGLSRTEGKFIEIPDRREAIEYSLSHAQEGDIIAIIGKGHEDYQEIEGVRHPFLDRTVVQEAVQKLGM